MAIKYYINKGKLQKEGMKKKRGYEKEGMKKKSSALENFNFK